jgi:hypothetical protein
MSQVKGKKSRSILVDKQARNNYPTKNSRAKHCDLCKGNEEKVTVFQNALKEVIDQNEALRSRVAELEALINEYEDYRIQEDSNARTQDGIE